MSIPYVTGTVSVTNGSAVVTGAGTAWTTAVVNGGLFGLDGSDGNPIPILSIDSDTQLTLAKPWRGATGAGQGYWIQRDTAYGQQTVANAQALSTYLQRLDNASLSALASLAASMSADKFAYATGLNTMAWTALSTFNREMLALGDAAAVRNKIGAFSTGGGTIGGNVAISGTLTTTGIVKTTSAQVRVDAGPTTTKQVILSTNDTVRWGVGAYGTGETGGNVGSDFFIDGYSDAAAWLGTAFTINRKHGGVHTPRTPAVSITLSPNTALTPGQRLGMGSFFEFQRGGFTLGGNPGSGFNALHFPIAGWYRLWWYFTGVASTASLGSASLWLNGSIWLGGLTVSANGLQTTLSRQIFVNAGDYLIQGCDGQPIVFGDGTRLTAEWMSP